MMNWEIPLERMEALEKKHNVNIFLECKLDDKGEVATRTYYLLNDNKERIAKLGSSIEEVEEYFAKKG